MSEQTKKILSQVVDNMFANSINLDLVSFTLSNSLDDALQDLGQIYEKSELSSHQMADYVDNIHYCKALITVLESYTMIDYTDLRVKLNKYEDKLREVF